MYARRDVYQAVADPIRRAIIQKLAGETLSLGKIASDFHVSQPAISRQVKILMECGLVHVAKSGRENLYSAKLDGLSEIIEWAERYRTFWRNRLDKLEELLSDDR